MSLTIWQRSKGGVYYLRGTVRGQRVYESTGTREKRHAEGLRAKREAELWNQSVYGLRATASFARAAASYLSEENRRADTSARIAKLLDHFGTTKLTNIDQPAVDRAYMAILGKDVSNATKLRSVLTPLRAIMRHAAVRRWGAMPVFQSPRQAKTKIPFLRPDQAAKLVLAAPPHLKPLIIFLFGTGARMSEGLELEWDHVDLIGARAILNQKQGNQRHADLPRVVVDALNELSHRHGRVFRKAATKRQLRLGRCRTVTGTLNGTVAAARSRPRGQAPAPALACLVFGKNGDTRHAPQPMERRGFSGDSSPNIPLTAAAIAGQVGIIASIMIC